MEVRNASTTEVAVIAFNESGAVWPPYPTAASVEKDVTVLQIFDNIVPEVNTLKRFLERRKTRLRCHEKYMQEEYHETLAGIRETLKDGRFYTPRNRRKQGGSDGTESPRDSNLGCWNEIDIQEMQRPSWTRRWSAWIAPSWQQTSDDEYGSDISQPVTATYRTDNVPRRPRQSDIYWKGAIRETPCVPYRPPEDLCLGNQIKAEEQRSLTTELSVFDTPPLPPLRSPEDLVLGGPPSLKVSELLSTSVARSVVPLTGSESETPRIIRPDHASSGLSQDADATRVTNGLAFPSPADAVSASPLVEKSVVQKELTGRKTGTCVGASTKPRSSPDVHMDRSQTCYSSSRVQPGQLLERDDMDEASGEQESIGKHFPIKVFSATNLSAITASREISPPPLKFQKIRTRRLGRSSSLSSALRSSPGASDSTIGGVERAAPVTSVIQEDATAHGTTQMQFSQEKAATKRSPNNNMAKAQHYQEAILSDIETDLDIVADCGVDTDTDREGRSATRCFVLDSFDGQPHPFWGVEVEQSSWVSIPNPSKLDPELKVLRMMKALKQTSSTPEYNSHLLVRHYKAFLKYGMFPEFLFELWGRNTLRNDYVVSEVEVRDALSKVQREISLCPPLRPVATSTVDEAAQDLAWVRQRVREFKRRVRQVVRRPRRSEYDNISAISIPCPVDPTWRNVYSSRAIILKRQSRKILLDNINDPSVDKFEAEIKRHAERERAHTAERAAEKERVEADTAELERVEDKKAELGRARLGKIIEQDASSILAVTSEFENQLFITNHTPLELSSQPLDQHDSASMEIQADLAARLSGSTSATATPVASNTMRNSMNLLKMHLSLHTPKTETLKRFPSCPSWNSQPSEHDEYSPDYSQEVVAEATKFLQRRAVSEGDLRRRRSLQQFEVEKVYHQQQSQPLHKDIGRFCLPSRLSLSALRGGSPSDAGGVTSKRMKQHEEQQDLIEAAVFAQASVMGRKAKSFYTASPARSNDLATGGNQDSLKDNGAGSGVCLSVSSHKPLSSCRSDSSPISLDPHQQVPLTCPEAAAMLKEWQFQLRSADYRRFKECRRRIMGRGKLKARKGRRNHSNLPDVQREGEAWIRFHQIRDIRKPECWETVLPPPVPNPSFINYFPEDKRGGVWPSFIPTTFRGPGRYEDIQEALLQILWSTRNSALQLPSPKKENLKLWIGGFMIPHDDKRFRYGDDAWFGSEPLSCLGVCDGVGEMSDTQWRAAGFDCRGFGEDILREAKSRLQTIRTNKCRVRGSRPRMILQPNHRRCDKTWSYVPFEVDSETSSPSILALESIICGFYQKTTTWGAATCLFGCLNNSGSKVGFANIGDSRAAVLRRGDFSTGPLAFVGSTDPEQHGWNLPVQLARLPDRSRIRSMREDPRLHELVKTLDACRATGQDINDPAESAVLYDFSIQEGDLIILGTDGLWDNVFDNEVAALCGLGISPFESGLLSGSPFMSTAPRDIAKGLCLAAYWRSLHNTIDTPFAQSVRTAGGVMLGGKPDDITVVAAWVVPEKEENTPELLARCQSEIEARQQRAECDRSDSSEESIGQIWQQPTKSQSQAPSAG